MTLFEQIKDLLLAARQQTLRQVNHLMVHTYFQIGKYIVEYEQQGQHRAGYGKETLKQVADRLGKDFGKGFSVDNLQNMRSF